MLHSDTLLILHTRTDILKNFLNWSYLAKHMQHITTMDFLTGVVREKIQSLPIIYEILHLRYLRLKVLL
jgi:hypothetical protein